MKTVRFLFRLRDLLAEERRRRLGEDDGLALLWSRQNRGGGVESFELLAEARRVEASLPDHGPLDCLLPQMAGRCVLLPGQAADRCIS